MLTYIKNLHTKKEKLSASYECYDKNDFCMGTVITQRIYSTEAKKAAYEASRELKRLESLMSFFIEGSDIAKVNSAAGICDVQINPETLEVIQKSIMFSEISSGSFDVTVAPVVKCWGIMSSTQKVPLKKEIEQLIKLVDFRCIKYDTGKRTVYLEKKGQMMELGGIAKGYAADKVIEIYRKNNICSAFVNLGGNVMVLGTKQDGSYWKIGIQNPRATLNDIIGYLLVKDKTVVTSGDYQRYFAVDGVRYHHIIDPKTGYPANSGVISVTIVTDCSINADALSTAVFILGIEKGVRMISRFENTNAVLITEDSTVYVTHGLKNSFFLTDVNMKLEYI
jgi:thiamine biosynthesis lipoprotein